MNLYINSANFSTATTVYLDSLLSNIAPDGYYSSQGYYRRQLDGVLLDVILCPSLISLCYGSSASDVCCNCNNP